MALISKETIETNATEIFSLYQAIDFTLWKPLEYNEKLTIGQYLAVEPLRKVAKRLYNRLLAETGRAFRTFKFSFAPEELLAIHLCIQGRIYDQHLQVILGKVQQKVLNYDTKIELNQNA